MFTFHAENCKEIYQVLQENFLEQISDGDAIIKLKQCDLSNISSFDKDTQNQINELLDKERLVSQ